MTGKITQKVAPELYAKHSPYFDLARVGLAAVTLLDLTNPSGIIDILGDATLLTALTTDTSYWQNKSLKGAGSDAKKLKSGVESLIEK